MSAHAPGLLCGPSAPASMRGEVGGVVKHARSVGDNISSSGSHRWMLSDPRMARASSLGWDIMVPSSCVFVAGGREVPSTWFSWASEGKLDGSGSHRSTALFLSLFNASSAR